MVTTSGVTNSKQGPKAT